MSHTPYCQGGTSLAIPKSAIFGMHCPVIVKCSNILKFVGFEFFFFIWFNFFGFNVTVDHSLRVNVCKAFCDSSGGLQELIFVWKA